MDTMFKFLLAAGAGAYGYHVYKEKYGNKKNPEDDMEEKLKRRYAELDAEDLGAKPKLNPSSFQSSSDSDLKRRLEYLERRLEENEKERSRGDHGIRNSRFSSDYDE